METDISKIHSCLLPFRGIGCSEKKQKDILTPHGDTHLLPGDVIAVIGNGEVLQDFRKNFMS
ncbi:TrkA C-terminal domain-containing protein [Fulvivirga sp. M361]|uniref:TrkA C-terminal domain-containing protein n=1 Tax=Fulvivirga sp. M361 TaxID=2594266 RepID=UPI0016256267